MQNAGLFIRASISERATVFLIFLDRMLYCGTGRYCRKISANEIRHYIYNALAETLVSHREEPVPEYQACNVRAITAIQNSRILLNIACFVRTQNHVIRFYHIWHHIFEHGC